MIGYKLFRVRKNGSLGSLFINKKQKLFMNQWYEAEEHPTRGYALRPGWHVLKQPMAPHLSLKGRVWHLVEIKDYTEVHRPEEQGGTWLIAKRMRILRRHEQKAERW